MKRFDVLFIVLLLITAVGAHATPIGIDDFDASSALISFDELSSQTVVSNQYYKDYGVMISGLTRENAQASVYAIEAINNAVSVPNYIGLQQNGWTGSIFFDFSQQALTKFGTMVIDSENTRLEVFDANGVSIEAIEGSGLLYEFLGIDTKDQSISYAVVSGDFFALDDVRFNAPIVISAVSEPATWALFLLVAFGFMSIRLKSSTQ